MKLKQTEYEPASPQHCGLQEDSKSGSAPGQHKSSVYKLIWKRFNSRSKDCKLKSAIASLIQENEYAELSTSSVPKAPNPESLLNPSKEASKAKFRQRAVVFDWLLSLANNLGLRVEVPYCALRLLDTCVYRSTADNLSLVDVYVLTSACLLFAIKLYEINTINIKDLLGFFGYEVTYNSVVEKEAAIFAMTLELPLFMYNSIQLVWLIAAYLNLCEKDLYLCLYLHESACYCADLVADQNLLVEGVFYVFFEKIKASKRKREKITKFFSNKKNKLEAFSKRLCVLSQQLHWSGIKSIKRYYRNLAYN